MMNKATWNARMIFAWMVPLTVIAFVIGVAHALSVVPASEGNFFFNTWHPADGLPLFEGDLGPPV